MRFRLENHGSLWLVCPLSKRAVNWLTETAPEGASFLGRNLAVEPRYVHTVVDAISAAGGKVYQ